MGDSTFNGGWIFAFLIIAVIFGWGNGGLGGNANAAAYATITDVNQAIANQSASQALGAIQLSSANNNYETAQLINQQSMNMMNQNNTNLLAAINGFNAVNQNIATGFSSVNQNIADLGYKMDQCCCSIKTMLLENRLQDAQAALVTSQNVNAINAQSQYLLSQLGSFVPAA
jgi:hypothetical protein